MFQANLLQLHELKQNEAMLCESWVMSSISMTWRCCVCERSVLLAPRF